MISHVLPISTPLSAVLRQKLLLLIYLMLAFAISWEVWISQARGSIAPLILINQ